jgi:hypothetical protein
MAAMDSAIAFLVFMDEPSNISDVACTLQIVGQARLRKCEGVRRMKILLIIPLLMRNLVNGA